MIDAEILKMLKDNICQIQTKLDTVITTITSSQLTLQAHELRIAQIEEKIKETKKTKEQKAQTIFDTVIKVMITAFLTFAMAKIGFLN